MNNKYKMYTKEYGLIENSLDNLKSKWSSDIQRLLVYFEWLQLTNFYRSLNNDELCNLFNQPIEE